MSLELMQRPAAESARGALFLFHGSGSWEGEMMPLADLLDPDHRLDVFAPRGPLQLPDEHGFRWFATSDFGDPVPESFAAGSERVGWFIDDALERAALPAERAIFAGFSMGAAVSYTQAFSAERQAPAGVIAFGGFLPVLSDASWRPQFEGREDLPVLIVHGEADHEVDFGFAEIAMNKLSAAGLSPELVAFAGGHEIDLDVAVSCAGWVQERLP